MSFDSLLVAMTVALISAQPSFARPEASFDCATATTVIEKLICSSDELANLDRSLAAYYAVARSTFAESRECLRADQMRWLHEVRNRCADAECIERAYLERLADLNAIQPGASAITYRELPALPPLIAVIPPDGDAQSIPREPTRDVQFAARYAFDADYGLAFVNEQQRRFVLTALNQSEPYSLSALQKERTDLIVRGKVLQKAPAADSYPDIPPPHAEFDPSACVFVTELMRSTGCTTRRDPTGDIPAS